ncbi:hypothetical protein OIU34_03705 [Pararhizobium sp. BT-229]|uniref:hypothetical protein n=1 Tax=Pararhizobium sp. BT-229 TaxID=2986923 RepID=UPI0021F6BEAB|nr:hypothetical protein [Pararhizobium sp. BT-229]MCV9960996.1 hypothetical protein [Pararhizobium sp. BT-229]
MLAIIIPLVCLGLIVWVLGMVLWSMRRGERQNQPEWPPYPLIDASEEEMQRRHFECRHRLSHATFGTQVARDLYRKLMTCEPGSGLIYEFHRDYCGHGLIRTGNAITLREIYDGGHTVGDPILSWDNEADFVAFFARQSDFTCSGWDPGEPVFFTDDSWAQNNQRLTSDVIRKFIKG